MPISFSLSSSASSTHPTSAYPSEYHPKGPCEEKSIRNFAEDKYRTILESRELRSDKAKLLNFLEGLTNDIIGLDKSKGRGYSAATATQAAAAAPSHLYVPTPLPAELRIPSQSSLSKIKQLRGSFDAKDGGGALPASSYASHAVEQVRPAAKVSFSDAGSSSNNNNNNSNNNSSSNSSNEHVSRDHVHQGRDPIHQDSETFPSADKSAYASAVRSSGSYSPLREPLADPAAAPMPAVPTPAAPVPPLKYTDEVDLSSTTWRSASLTGGASGKRAMAIVPPEANQKSLDLSDLTASRMEEIRRA